MPLDVQKLLRDQQADLKRWDAILADGQRRIDAIDRQLPREVIASRSRDIRNHTLDALREVRAAVQQRAQDARAAARGYTPEALRRRATFDPDSAKHGIQSAAWSARLAKVPTAELIEYARDSVAEGNAALAELIRLEFKSRADRQNLDPEFDRHLDGLRLTGSEESPYLRQVAGLLDLADQRLGEFMKGRSDPVGRITAVRKAGVVAVASEVPPPSK